MIDLDGLERFVRQTRADMLHELRVRNLVLIDSLDLCLDPGFNVMTGETGAGKSVIVGALQLVLGGRATAELVRPNTSCAEIEALFEFPSQSCASQYLPDSVIDSIADSLAPTCSKNSENVSSELVVRRVVLSSNRSRVYLNGQLSTAQNLSKIAPCLADIASQHQSISLTNIATHVSYLDAFGQLDSQRQRISELVRELQQLRAKVDELRQLRKRRAEQQEFIRFQLNAIEQLNPQPGELENLKSERVKLRHAEKLTDTAIDTLNQLAGDQAICDKLRRVLGSLSYASSLDTSLADVAFNVQQALDFLEETCRFLSRYVESNHADPARLDTIESRLFDFEKLLRRYGPTENELLAAKTKLMNELDALEQVDDAISELQAQFETKLNQAGQLAFALSDQRQTAAKHLADSIGVQLNGLAMGGAHVQVQVVRQPAQGDLVFNGARLCSDGVDRVEFLISPNKGMEPRPLRKIASGGELSRALLAIKRVLASQGPACLYVFDEVDAGVGGAVAERIGQALAQIAKHHQVLCITHLAPIAALADAHFVVRKIQTSEIARTEVVRVQGDQRVQELARMLSGKNITKASIQTATEMIAARR